MKGFFAKRGKAGITSIDNARQDQVLGGNTAGQALLDPDKLGVVR